MIYSARMILPAYIALCLVVPAAWGVLMYKAFDWLARRRAEGVDDRGDNEQPPIDYSI